MSASEATRRWRALGAVAVLATGLGIGAVHAEDNGKQAARDREMARRAQLAQRKAEDEKAVLLQEKQKLEADAGEAKAQLDKSTAAMAQERRRAMGLQADLDAAAKARDALQKEKDTIAARAGDLDAKLKQTMDELNRTKAALATTQADLAARSDLAKRLAHAGEGCEDRNRKLYGVATELIGKYRNQGVLDSIRRKEPFTGLRKVEVDNLLEGYQDRADDARPDPTVRSPR